ncbi:MAG: Fe-S cluster assembly protein SufD [Pseudomonadota bacterium]
MNLQPLQQAMAMSPELADWQQAERQEALDALLASGFPGRKDEAWKYTRADAFAAFATSAAGRTTPADVDTTAMAQAYLTRCEASYAVVLVDGVLQPDLIQLPTGVDVTTRQQRLPVGEGTEAAMSNLARAIPASDLVINASADVDIDEPVHLLQLVTDGQLAQSLIQITLAPNARVGIAEHVIAADGASDLMTNTAMQIQLADHASLRHSRLQQLNGDALQATRIDATLAEHAALSTFTLDVGARLVRNDLNVRLEGEHSNVEMRGLYLLDDAQHVDNHTRVDHVARDTRSDEDYRGILRDKSRAVFNGKVVVHVGADGTNAAQSNPNLLLSDHAEIDTKPELEIYADDVKCAHGATVGQLDETALFYLRSRGVSESVATQLLTYAFCREVLQDHDGPALRRMTEQLLAQQIPEFTALDIIE